MRNLLILGLLAACSGGQSVDSGVQTVDEGETIIEVKQTIQSQTTGPDGWVTMTIMDPDDNMHLASCDATGGHLEVYVNTEGPETLDFEDCLSFENQLFTPGAQIWFEDGQVTGVYSPSELAAMAASEDVDREKHQP